MAAAQTPPTSRADRVQWLQQHAAPIRSTDPADEDFADLAPLRAAIGKSRIVMLGEQSHGDGTTFLAKTRMIKYLHEKLGFDGWRSQAGATMCRGLGNCSRAARTPRLLCLAA